MTSPWLSILIPTYNGAAYLRDALDSILAQQDPGVECIAVDDGSSDNTLEILEQYRGRLSMAVMARPRTGNWVANTNLALEHASAPFACLLHQDDVWQPDRLATMRDAVAAYPSVNLFLHPAWFIDGHGRRLGRWGCPLPKAPSLLDSEMILPRLLVQNFIAIPAPMFRIETARQVGGLDESLWYTADWDFWLKLSAVGRTVCLPQRLACFRVHPEAQTNRRSIDIADYRRQHEVVLERHLPKLAIGGHGSRSVRRGAELSIAVNAALAGRYHGERLRMADLAAAAWRAWPLGLWRYLRCARLWERVSARLKALRRGGRPVGGLGDDAVVQ